MVDIDNVRRGLGGHDDVEEDVCEPLNRRGYCLVVGDDALPGWSWEVKERSDELVMRADSREEGQVKDHEFDRLECHCLLERIDRRAWQRGDLCRSWSRASTRSSRSVLASEGEAAVLSVWRRCACCNRRARMVPRIVSVIGATILLMQRVKVDDNGR